MESDFFVQKSARYYEVSYSLVMPFLNRSWIPPFVARRSGGRFDRSVELMAGFDYGDNSSLKGVNVTQVFLNLRFHFTEWEYRATELNIAAGFGIGLQLLGINYDTTDVDHKGDPVLPAGDPDFARSVTKPAIDFFTELDFRLPIGPLRFLRGSAAMRGAFSLGHFEKEFAGLLGFPPEGPRGRLGNFYLMIGLTTHLR